MSHPVSVITTQFRHVEQKQAETINKWVWLCFNKTLFIKTDNGHIWPTGRSLLTPLSLQTLLKLYQRQLHPSLSVESGQPLLKNPITSSEVSTLKKNDNFFMLHSFISALVSDLLTGAYSFCPRGPSTKSASGRGVHMPESQVNKATLWSFNFFILSAYLGLTKKSQG